MMRQTAAEIDMGGAEDDSRATAPAHWRRAVSVVAAIIRHDQDVLLVRNVASGGAPGRWSLPGGSVHTGELLTEAVVREVYEETGLVVEKLGPVAVYSEHFIPAYADAMLMLAFEVTRWSGALRYDEDPDGDVCDCAFVPAAEAAALIEHSTGFAPVARPVAAYLRGLPQRSWFWRVQVDGSGGDSPIASV